MKFKKKYWTTSAVTLVIDPPLYPCVGEHTMWKPPPLKYRIFRMHHIRKRTRTSVIVPHTVEYRFIFHRPWNCIRVSRGSGILNRTVRDGAVVLNALNVTSDRRRPDFVQGRRWYRTRYRRFEFPIKFVFTGKCVSTFSPSLPRAYQTARRPTVRRRCGSFGPQADIGYRRLFTRSPALLLSRHSGR